MDGERTILHFPSYDQIMEVFKLGFREGLVAGETLDLIKKMSNDKVNFDSSKRKAIVLPAVKVRVFDAAYMCHL